MVSELMGGKNAEQCQGSIIKGLGSAPIRRLSFKVIDNVSRHPSYAGIELTQTDCKGETWFEYGTWEYQIIPEGHTLVGFHGVIANHFNIVQLGMITEKKNLTLKQINS